MMRGRRKSLQPRNGLKVGDPGTTGIALNGDTGTLVADGTRAMRGQTQHPAKRKSNHARGKAPAPFTINDYQYVRDFFQASLNRQPTTSSLNEEGYWNDILRAALYHGQGAPVMAMRELGKTLLESTEYAARGQTDHWYVNDLYHAYLQRAPDSGGWTFWEGQLSTHSREDVRRGFDESSEFISDVANIASTASASSSVTSLLTARVDANNQGGSGLLGRPAEWSVSLLSLPGRAGLDLGLGLSYSSAATWTKSGPYLYFDEDNSPMSPGFRLGFPTVQELYFDAQVGQNAYLLITSAGSRVELRQRGTSNVYEAADSSHLQLTDNSSSTSTLLVRSTDGTQMTYSKLENEWHCVNVKDRNGNYLTVNYSSLGDLTSVVDTLHRTVNFNYDSNANLSTITQDWNGSTPHTWASFSWDNKGIQPGFSGVELVGFVNATTVPVISAVGLDDGTSYSFYYPSSGTYGQTCLVAQITRVVSSAERAYTAFDYTSDSGDVTPRISATRVWAENWNLVSGTATEVTTQFSIASDGGHRMLAPDGTIYKEYYGTTWQKGLVTGTKIYANTTDEGSNSPKKWTTTAWDHDGTSSCQLNPRVTETNIYDADGNRRKTTVGYASAVTLPDGASCTLPADVYEYTGSGGTTLQRRTHTDYNMDSTYLNRWIIGLTAAQYLCDASEGATPCSASSGSALFAKTTFQYDESGSAVYQAAPTQQDNTNYGSGMVAGRGNLSSTRRYDVSNLSLYVSSSMVYNTAGSPIEMTDGASHESTISYTDAFSANGVDATTVSYTTMAYPTTLTNADGMSATIKYHYDFGAKTRTQSPTPAGQSQGRIQKFVYDSAGRLDRVTTVNNSAYTRYVYGPNYVQSYASVNNVADEAFAIQTFDGAGRVFAAASNHPGSSGTYRGQRTVYDKMGRAVEQTNPTEINSSWSAYGDDSAGWSKTTQTYDWKGRPLLTTNPDTTTETASYGGCGCAGGEVVTLTDEVGRKQKVYADPLGRMTKTEIYSDATTIYATSENTYNVRDQVTLVRQYQGASTSSTTYQDTTMTYDGHGRLKTKHVPEQQVDSNNSASTNYTTWDYNADDTIQKITDARGAYSTFSYNNRHLVTEVAYDKVSGVPTTGTWAVPSAPTVNFEYDNAGNRTVMTDGVGSTSYSYDELSRMTSESRTFTGLGTYAINYTYNLAGELSSITDPFSSTISYSRDNAGRLTAVTGTSSGGVTTYASNIQYRAWGAIKYLSSGDSKTLQASFDSRLQPSAFSVSGSISKTYDYSDDGKLSFSSDLLDHHFDRSYGFDQVGRLTEAFSGAEARGGSATTDRPYNEAFGYDAFDHLTGRTGKLWWTTNYTSSESYLNNRRVGWQYDADGRIAVQNPNEVSTYDEAGVATNIKTSSVSSATFGVDGTGQQSKTSEITWDDESQTSTTETKYYLRSSVLGGQVLTELSDLESRTFVYAGLAKLAWQVRSIYGAQFVFFEHSDPSGASARTLSEQEFDPLGADTRNPPEQYVPDEGALISYGDSYNAANPAVAYTVDGIRVSADNFIARGGFLLQEKFGLLEAAARQDANPIGYRFSGVNQGLSFNASYDANWNRQNLNFGNFDVEGWGTGYRGDIEAIYGNSSGLLEFLGNPPKSGFLIGRFGFNGRETERLGRAYDKIISDKCRTFFDATLATLRQKGEISSRFQTTPSTLAGTLAITTINKYSSNLTAKDVGVSQSSWNNIRDKFDNPGFSRHALGVTIADGRVFLPETAFYQAGPISQMLYRNPDLAGIITHELFHRAGLNEDQFTKLRDDIQQNCGSPSDALGN
jgi:YD repeat-containing protein